MVRLKCGCLAMVKRFADHDDRIMWVRVKEPTRGCWHKKLDMVPAKRKELD